MTSNRQIVEEFDLSGYVRGVTLVLLLDLRKDVDLTVSYLMPLWDLLSNYLVDLDHASLAQQIDRDHGVEVGAQYREAVSRWREHRRQVARRNRANRDHPPNHFDFSDQICFFSASEPSSMVHPAT